MEKHPLVDEILFTHQQIRNRCRELAEKINQFYKKNNVTEITLIVVLKGAIPFLAEFINHLEIECQIEYLSVSSFLGGIKAAQKPKIVIDSTTNVTNQHLLIVEDIIDKGHSLKLIIDTLTAKNPQSIKVLTMLDKKSCRQVDLAADWVGFEILDNKFLIGFGLDYQERLRNLPYVATVNLDKIDSWKW